LDGVQARAPKIAHFNGGNVPFELQIQNNTLVSNLGKYEVTSSKNIKPDRVELNDVLNTFKLISK